MAYGYFGTMRTVPGHRDQVVRILLSSADGLRDVGCSVYSVSVPADDPDLICVYEVWDTKASHDASLTLPEVRAAIAAAMPMLTGEFTSRETTVLGRLP
ncbi:MAG TPA: putative quinol monooxygenase [Actinoplanes sp.]|nr:putative quinol monooxygenase [Actinoplanes sp.]